MKKRVGRENRINTIREHLKEIGALALANEVDAVRNREYSTALIHSKYVAAIEKVVGVCDSFTLLRKEIKGENGDE